MDHVLHSPTIHKSLEDDLDRVSIDDYHDERNGADTVSDTSTEVRLFYYLYILSIFSRPLHVLISFDHLINASLL